MPRGVYERKPRDTSAAPSATPPQKREKKARKYKRARPAEAAPFIPAIDVERRLVLVNGGAPQVFNPQQTEAIATLLLNHFEV